VFVGDSVNRNQWVSLVCMVEASIPDDRLKTRIFNGSLISFKALVYMLCCFTINPTGYTGTNNDFGLTDPNA
jgi:hypothetical protein